MSTSSSSSSRSTTRRSVYGVPTRCWCGKGLITWVSETKENPYRRFYRCAIALQKKTEDHLFKWVDEAILDEVRIVDAKVSNLGHDFHLLSKNVTDQLESHKIFLARLEGEMIAKLNEKMSAMSQSMENTTTLFKEDIEATLKATINTTQLTNKASFPNIALAGILFVAVTCLFSKLL